MILSRKRNFVFLRVTKTASTSITHHLLDHIPKEEIDHIARNDYIADIDHQHRTNSRISGHATLGDLIRANVLTFDEAISMRIYAVMRDPIDRFLSAAHCHHASMNNISDFFSPISNEDAVDQYLESKSLESTGMSLPQFYWLLFDNKLINNIIVYPNFDTMFADLGVSKNIKYLHRSHHRSIASRTHISDYHKNKIISKYEKDWEIWQSLTT
jgi:hypothetical protein